MPDAKISADPSAASLDGTELIPIVKDGTNQKTTVSAIAAMAGGSGATVVFPFYKADGSSDTIALIAGSALPFYKADGNADNILLIAP